MWLLRRRGTKCKVHLRLLMKGQGGLSDKSLG